MGREQLLPHLSILIVQQGSPLSRCNIISSTMLLHLVHRGPSVSCLFILFELQSSLLCATNHMNTRTLCCTGHFQIASHFGSLGIESSSFITFIAYLIENPPVFEPFQYLKSPASGSSTKLCATMFLSVWFGRMSANSSHFHPVTPRSLIQVLKHN